MLYLTPAAVRWYILSRDPSFSSCITSSLGRQILNMASVIWTNINHFTSTAKYEADRGSLNIEARKNLLLTISVKMVRVVFQYFMQCEIWMLLVNYFVTNLQMLLWCLIIKYTSKPYIHSKLINTYFLLYGICSQ